MARRSRLTGSELSSIPYDKKQRAELVKLIAESEGVTVRTAQRRITSAGQRRGQENTLSIKAGNAVRKFFRDNPIVSVSAAGRTKSEVRGNLLIQETFSTAREAINRARQIKNWADGNEPGTAPPAEGKGGDDEDEEEEEDFREERDDDYNDYDGSEEVDYNDPDVYAGGIFDNVHSVEVFFVPGGSKYQEFDVRAREDEKLTAPPGGLWVVRGVN